MGARAITALTAAAGLLSAAPALSQAREPMFVAFLDAGQKIELKTPRVRVYDRDDTALFEAPRDYILAYAENPTGRVFIWDPATQRVRISLDGKDPLWIKCADLKPMTIACGPKLQMQGALLFVGEGEIPEAFRPAPTVTPPPGSSPYGTLPNGSGTGKGRGYAAGPGVSRGVPICPGDVRCRKVKGRP